MMAKAVNAFHLYSVSLHRVHGPWGCSSGKNTPGVALPLSAMLSSRPLYLDLACSCDHLFKLNQKLESNPGASGGRPMPKKF